MVSEAVSWLEALGGGNSVRLTNPATSPVGRDDRTRRELLLARAVLVHAFSRNPTLPWTPSGLSSWYGLRIDRVRLILADLVRCGFVVNTDGRKKQYRWRPSSGARTSARWAKARPCLGSA
jgi:hypothetical protein